MNYLTVALRDASILIHLLFPTIGPLLLGFIVVFAASESWELPTRKGGRV